MVASGGPKKRNVFTGTGTPEKPVSSRGVPDRKRGVLGDGTQPPQRHSELKGGRQAEGVGAV